MIINCLTYNISWATQINKTLGSESNFVEACQKTYKKGGIKCNEDAIKKLKTLPKLDLIALQEVNSDIETKLMNQFPHLSKFKRGTVGLSNVSTLWNPDIFGKLIYNNTFNLYRKEERPCLILIFKSGNDFIVVINVHMPWDTNHKKAFNKIRKELETKQISKFINENTKIIMMGDFNDSNTTIHKNSPLTIKFRNKSLKLSHKKNKSQARNTLKSCCWHKPKHKYKYFSDTGDYILVNENIKQYSIKIPNIYKKAGRFNRLYSDHMPVIAKIKL